MMTALAEDYVLAGSENILVPPIALAMGPIFSVHARKRPYGPLTRRYAPTAATPCRDHSDGAHKDIRRI
ncbi:hypothetical protein SM39_pSMC2_69 (plasmid) [Serratia marcescens SM39]|nr:hypothetical protein SM39_pSMC2_69 [Serratia marcescens SM39]